MATYSEKATVMDEHQQIIAQAEKVIALKEEIEKEIFNTAHEVEHTLHESGWTGAKSDVVQADYMDGFVEAYNRVSNSLDKLDHELREEVKGAQQTEEEIQSQYTPTSA